MEGHYSGPRSMILLVHPPVVRPSEPPAGVAALAGALRGRGLEYRVIDANLEGLLHLLSQSPDDGEQQDTWTRRALRHRDSHIVALRNRNLYGNLARYRRAVGDLTRVLEKVSVFKGCRVGLADYEDRYRSPLKSADLLKAAEAPEDNPFFPYFSERLAKTLAENSPDIVGFSLNYLSQALSTFAMAGFVRREARRSRLVLGGGLVTSWMGRSPWKNPFGGLFDEIIGGPGEEGFLRFLTGTPTGLCRPDYDDLADLDYLSPGFVLPFASSRGCYWRRCAFCPERSERNPFMQYTMQGVLDDLAYLVKLHRPSLVHFVDSAITPSFMRRLARGAVDCRWYGFARVTEELTDGDFCRALRSSGCVMLQLGVESGSQRVLDELGKGIRTLDAALSLRLLKEAGVGTYVYLLFGTPPETGEDAKITLDFVAENAPFIDYLNISLFNMPLDTREGDDGVRRFYEGDLSLYSDFVHPSGWDRGKVRQFLETVFRRHPAVAAILRRHPPVFTSSHAPFFLTIT